MIDVWAPPWRENDSEVKLKTATQVAEFDGGFEHQYAL
jgi:hypothetical protein